MSVLGVVGEGLIELGLEPSPDATVTLGFGGDACNTAVMAARLGCGARIGGRVGADALGRRLLVFWEQEGVDVANVVVDRGGPTGIYVNERGSEGFHRFDYHRSLSAGSRLAPRDLGDAFFEGLGALHVTGITLAVSTTSEEAAWDAIRRARRRGLLVSLAVNHRPALGGDVERLAEAAGEADVVFLSEEEAELVGMPEAGEVVLTRGAAGAVLRSRDGEVRVTAPAVGVVDAAGAGDALAGAYLAARLAGHDAGDALRRGVAAASLSCRARGCGLSYPRGDEVEATIRSLEVAKVL